jgi:hypothetical protein
MILTTLVSVFDQLIEWYYQTCCTKNLIKEVLSLIQTSGD